MQANVRVGQHWRDEDGYLLRIIRIDERGVWCRHPNAKRAGHIVHPAWFEVWTKTKDA